MSCILQITSKLMDGPPKAGHDKFNVQSELETI
jgi:hypothetical protein